MSVFVCVCMCGCACTSMCYDVYTWCVASYLKKNAEMAADSFNDVDSQETIPDNVDIVISLSRAEQNGARRDKLCLHMFTQLHEKWLLKVAKGSRTKKKREKEKIFCKHMLKLSRGL